MFLLCFKFNLKNYSNIIKISPTINLWTIKSKCSKSQVNAKGFFSLFSSLPTSSDSEVNIEAGLKFRPPSGFTDSREFSEAECDREQRALDLEVQRTLENCSNGKIQQEELTSLLAR